MKKTINKTVAFIIMIIMITSISACYYDHQEELHPDISNLGCDTSGVITYNKQLAPLLLASCGSTQIGCHQTSNDANRNVSFNSYSDVAAINDSRLIGSINQDPNYSFMPKGGTKLSECQLTIIQKWVSGGKIQN